MEHNGFYDFLAKHSEGIKGLIYGVFLFLHIDTDIVKMLLWLMAIDTVAGIWKSAIINVRFSFRTLFFGVTTKAFVLLIPMALALVGKGLKYDFTPLVDVVLRALVVAEGISIFTAAYVIRTKRPVENIDFVTLLLSSIRKGLMKLLKLFLMKIENPDTVLGELKDEEITDKKEEI